MNMCVHVYTCIFDNHTLANRNSGVEVKYCINFSFSIDVDKTTDYHSDLEEFLRTFFHLQTLRTVKGCCWQVEYLLQIYLQCLHNSQELKIENSFPKLVPK